MRLSQAQAWQSRITQSLASPISTKSKSYRFSVDEMFTFLKSSCSIFSKPSSWSTLDARAGGDSLLLKAGNENRYRYGLLSLHRVVNSLVCTKWLYAGMHSGALRIHKWRRRTQQRVYRTHAAR